MSGELALMQQANRMLAEVSTPGEAWQLSRDAEAARRWAQMRNLGAEAVNHATGIKAKAMLLLADFVDAGQENGTIKKAGQKSIVGVTHNTSSLPEVLGTDSQKAREAVRTARVLRESLAGADIDVLVAAANERGEDFGISGLRRAAAETREPPEQRDPVQPLAGTYSALIVDPPWPMVNINRDVRPNQDNTRYATMTLEQIADDDWLPVRRMAANDAHLYLWVTHKFLTAGLELVEAWGFRYQCLMTWVKNVGITPFSWMYDTEHVIFARRGNLPLLRDGLRLSFTAPVTGHSRKPDVFYERVAEASPGPRTDMFAREARPGFDPWGNEAPSA